ncbi:hypothetical protein ACFL4N_05570 [Thermodesulfobacteriota bacterium]
MGKKHSAHLSFPIASLALILFLVLPFTAWSGEPKIENSLPREELSQYSHSFDKADEDLWEKSSFVPQKGQRGNFKLADMKIENGRLRIVTKTGAFSKGSYNAKFSLKGDFDMQVDCHLDFLEDISDMVQRAAFSVAKKGKDFKDVKIIAIQIMKSPRTGDRTIDTITLTRGKMKLRKRHFTENFHGTLRMVRRGKDITTMYKKEGGAGWKTLCSIPHTDQAVRFGFVGQNFWGKKSTIKAVAPFTVEYDNFRINGAQEIIEEDI